MTLAPIILPNRASRYLDVRQLVAAANRPDPPPAPEPVVVPGLPTTRSDRILGVLRGASAPMSGTAIAAELGCTAANVIEWLRRHGGRYGVVCVGVEPKPGKQKGSNLWAIERGAA